MKRIDRYKDIHLAQLRGFCLVADQGNFTTAARQLGLSLATVWEQVRALERKLRTTLVQRHGHAVEVTPEGRLLQELIQPCVGILVTGNKPTPAVQYPSPRKANTRAINFP